MGRLFLSLFFLPALLFAGTSVERTWNGQPFAYDSEVLETRRGYTVYRLTYPAISPPSFPEAKNVIAYYYRPDGMPEGGRQPAVLCLHILGGGGQITKTIASYFAERGMPALMPIMPMFLDRNPQGGRLVALRSADGPRLLGEVFHSCPLDIRRSLDVLSSFPEVDSEHVNLIGTSLGGILAVSTAGSDERIDKAMFLLSGGNLPKLLASRNHEVQPIRETILRANAEEKKQIDDALHGVEPLRFTERLKKMAADGRVRMVNAGADEVVPFACSQELADAIGLKQGAGFRVLPNVGHYTAITGLPDLLEETAEFFGGGKLRALPEEQPAAKSKKEVIARVFGQINKLVSWEPASGRAYEVAGRIRVTEQGEETYSSFCALRCGAGGKFYFSVDQVGFKGVDVVRFGCGERLWIESKNRIFQGDSAPGSGLGMRLSPQFRRIYAALQLSTALVAQSGSLKMFDQ
ncbi:MAG: dienelactone hydrolase family protein, partial [Kiritimatiellae bacterium]|nr:dienelactone hydrolase family protein [Kiritimatiellia bacterium]